MDTKEFKMVAKRKKKFGMKEFVKSVDKVMQKQERENPSLKQVHARLSPEWNRVSQKIAKLLSPQQKEESIEKLREEIVVEGEIATRVLIDLLLSLIKQPASSEKEASSG